MKLKKILFFNGFFYLFALALTACAKHTATPPVIIPADTGLVNTAHLDHLTVPVSVAGGGTASGVYIYSNAPDYGLIPADGEGFTCVDDVARAALVYLRSTGFSTDTAVSSRLYRLLDFVVEMQSSNGYFYNFLLSDNLINVGGATSVNASNWWSWRALQALTEAAPQIQTKNPALYTRVNEAIAKLISRIKSDLVNIPATIKTVNGVNIPEWLPAGSGTDQSATLILGLIPYCETTNDAVITTYIKKLADGISLMQAGDAAHYPYSCFLSWENQWHAYGSDQALAMMKAGEFLNDTQYANRGFSEVDNFYPWLITNGFKSSFSVSASGGIYTTLTDKTYDQIAYGVRPMVFAAAEAFKVTGQAKYADLAGHLAAWFMGANNASAIMYSTQTGRGYDGIGSPTSVNRNAGAESTIEALLTMQKVEAVAEIKSAFNKYKKQ